MRWRDAEHGVAGRWVGDWPVGVDEFGLYAGFAVGDIAQRSRWIEPGTFLMGSPGNETDRSDDETQHVVRLSRGYWLADTACTQAMWQAVMGDNASNFKDDRRPRNPVEQVSWKDVVQEFVPRLNRLVPGLEAGLPSEAQWEYACRAGTQTAFSFGETTTPEQVNYNGNYPYKGGRKGLNRQHTVPVGSLPANEWGLYEMHGNVWEWCSDWYGDYDGGSAVDPEGPEEGGVRVLRGGSWFIGAGRCRSAFRYLFEPGFRYHAGPGDRSVGIGFRLAPGRASMVGTTRPAEPAARARSPGRGTRPGPEE